MYSKLGFHCRFAHLINVDFFDDLFRVFNQLSQLDVSICIRIVNVTFCCLHFCYPFCHLHLLLLTLFVTYTFCCLDILAVMYLFQILSLSDVLNITQTAFTILSGQGEALNIDPQHFYTHLYRVLPQLTSGNIPLISYKLTFTSIHVYL